MIEMSAAAKQGGDTVENACGSCVGACCRKGIAMPLNRKEAAWMIRAGTELRLMDDAEWQGKAAKPGWRHDYYKLESDCGNLNPDTFLCEDYANRPEVCREFEPGSFMCGAMKKRQAMTVNLGMPMIRQPEQLPV